MVFFQYTKSAPGLQRLCQKIPQTFSRGNGKWEKIVYVCTHCRAGACPRRAVGYAICCVNRRYVKPSVRRRGQAPALQWVQYSTADGAPNDPLSKPTGQALRICRNRWGDVPITAGRPQGLPIRGGILFGCFRQKWDPFSRIDNRHRAACAVRWRYVWGNYARMGFRASASLSFWAWASARSLPRVVK